LAADAAAGNLIAPQQLVAVAADAVYIWLDKTGVRAIAQLQYDAPVYCVAYLLVHGSDRRERRITISCPARNHADGSGRSNSHSDRKSPDTCGSAYLVARRLAGERGIASSSHNDSGTLFFSHKPTPTSWKPRLR